MPGNGLVNDRWTMGHGVKQRDLIRMSGAEVDQFLRGRQTAVLSSISSDGAIHSVAMWYGFLEGAIAFETKARSQKVQNLRRNPNLTFIVESGQTYDELRGVVLVGRAEIVEEKERIWTLGVSVFERYHAPYTEDRRAEVEAILNKRVVIKLLVDRQMSWDHRKLRRPEEVR